MDETTRTARDIETLREWIRSTRPGGMVFFGGAGVSTESGIPDFRSADGIYSQGGAIPPEVMVSRSFFDAHPREFFDFYFSRMLFLDAQPNQAHRKLAELEREGTLSAVITQNVDGLHQMAGSRNVFELHGSLLRNHCIRCRAAYTLEEMVAAHAALRRWRAPLRLRRRHPARRRAATRRRSTRTRCAAPSRQSNAPTCCSSPAHRWWSIPPRG